jgi:hypothetical protein
MKAKKTVLLLFFTIHLAYLLFHNFRAMATFGEKDKTNLFLSSIAPFVLEKCKQAENILAPLFNNAFFDIYSIPTGATGYTFFSPNPPDPLQLYFITQLGPRKFATDLRMKTFEGKVRRDAICSLIAFDKEETDKLKTLKIRSIGARFFELNPHIKKTNLCVVQHLVPTIEEYKNGQKLRINPILSYEIQTP